MTIASFMRNIAQNDGKSSRQSVNPEEALRTKRLVDMMIPIVGGFIEFGGDENVAAEELLELLRHLKINDIRSAYKKYKDENSGIARIAEFDAGADLVPSGKSSNNSRKCHLMLFCCQSFLQLNAIDNPLQSHGQRLSGNHSLEKF